MCTIPGLIVHTSLMGKPSLRLFRSRFENLNSDEPSLRTSMPEAHAVHKSYFQEEHSRCMASSDS